MSTLWCRRSRFKPRCSSETGSKLDLNCSFSMTFWRAGSFFSPSTPSPTNAAPTDDQTGRQETVNEDFLLPFRRILPLLTDRTALRSSTCLKDRRDAVRALKALSKVINELLFFLCTNKNRVSRGDRNGNSEWRHKVWLNWLPFSRVIEPISNSFS